MPLKMLGDRTNQFLTERAFFIFDQATDTFFELADGMTEANQQTQYYDAIKILRADKTNILNLWLDGISAAFSHIAHVVDSEDSDQAYKASGNSLSLLGDDNLEEVVVFDRMVSAANAKNHQDLHLLERRISKLLNNQIAFQQLPMSPEFITDQFAIAMRACDLAPLPKLSLLALYEGAVLDQISNLLSQCNQLLKDLGVLPELGPEMFAGDENVNLESTLGGRDQEFSLNNLGESAVSSPISRHQNSGHQNFLESFEDGPKKKPAPGDQFDVCQVGRGGQAELKSRSPLIVNLKNVLMEKEVNPPKEISPKSNGHDRLSSEELLDILKNNAVNGWVTDDRLDSDVDSLASREKVGVRVQIEQILTSQGDRFNGLDDIDQAIIILVDKLFRQAGKRQNTPEKLSPLLSRLELFTVKFALADQSFFDLEQHPVRRLLNEVAVAANSLGGVETLENDPLFKKLDEVIARLESAETDLAQLTDLLSDFVKFTEWDRQRIGVLERRAMEEAAANEKIDAARKSVDELLGSRLIGNQFGYALVHFSEKAWSHVLFRARLKYGLESDQWVQAVHLLDQLLELESMSEFDKDFFDRLTATLTESLNDISYDDYESQRVFSNIQQYLLEDKNKAENIHPVVFDKYEAEQVGDYSLRVTVEHIDADLPGEGEDVDKGLHGLIDDNLLAEIDSLKKGAWVELSDDEGGCSKHCRLIGKVESTGKYVFGDRNGRNIFVASRNHLAVKMKGEKIIVLDNSHLFDEALSKIIHDTRKIG